ncbi:MAG TPA: hypothetical protein VFR62_04830, partial [Gemmatimonadales bacterium]|nr:hypothetical protein [Gemmatimonadales bacterium]
ALLLTPLLWLMGMVLRYAGLRAAGFDPSYLTWLAQQPFAAPGQLAAYEQNRSVVIAGYAVLVAACLVGVPAFCTFAKIAAERSPVLAHLARIHGLTWRCACCGVIWVVGGLGVGRGVPDSPVCRLLRGSWLSG